MKTTFALAAAAALLAPLASALEINACNDCTDGVAGGTCTDITLDSDGCTNAPGTQCWKLTNGDPVTEANISYLNGADCTGNSHRADQCEVQDDGYCVSPGTESFSGI